MGNRVVSSGSSISSSSKKRSELQRWWLKLGAQGGPTNLKASLRLLVERM